VDDGWVEDIEEKGRKRKAYDTDVAGAKSDQIRAQKTPRKARSKDRAALLAR
jgi:hypothetical protein